LRNESGYYFLNGNWKIDFPQTIEIAGTLFEYERNRYGSVGQEKIAAKGPTTEPIVLGVGCFLILENF
jgi:papilin